MERHYPEFVATREAAGRPLPSYVQEEFEAQRRASRRDYATAARIEEPELIERILARRRERGDEAADPGLDTPEMQAALSRLIGD